MLKFNVTGDRLELTSSRSFNSGSKGYYTAEFTFDGDWDGLIPHIAITENGTERADEVIVDNAYKIATTESGVMQISVYGLDAEGKKCISCNYVCIEVKQGGYKGVTPLPKDIWDGYQITVLGYLERAEKSAENSEKAAASIKNLSVTATEGTEVSVEQTETDEGINLAFTLPRGAKGDVGDKGDTGEKGEKGDKGDAPIKGVDYFTEEEKEELLSEPREVIHLANGMSIESREDGIYLTGVDEDGNSFESFLCDTNGYTTVHYAEEAGFAGEAEYAYAASDAENDANGRPLKGIITEDYGDVEDADFSLSDGYALYYGVISNSIIAAKDVDEMYPGFEFALYFTTPTTLPENYTQFPAEVCFKGDSTDNGAFIPEPNMRYTIVFDFDGYMLNGYVSGVTTV